MNREDIIRMAREAGINVEQGHLLRFAGVEDDLERFTALVAAAEREACAAIAELEASGWGGFDSGFKASHDIAAAIRARKETT